MGARTCCSASNRLVNRLQYYCLVLDVDGTLVNDAKEITGQNQLALLQYQQAGGRIILASGRLPLSLRWIGEELQLNPYYLALNGAVAGQGDTCLAKHAFRQQAVLDCLEFCRQRSLYCHIYTTEGIWYDRENYWNENWPERNLVWLEGQQRDPERIGMARTLCLARQVADLAEAVQAEKPLIYKMAVFSQQALAGQWEELAAVPGLNVTSSDLAFNLEIAPEHISKGDSLAWLAGQLEIAAGEVMAIGDNFNDITMLSWAGLGVAMGNAPAAVKERADAVTDTNQASGVAAAIARWGNRRQP